MLDLKALENHVLIPSRKKGKIEIYQCAKGETTDKFYICSGEESRDAHIGYADYNKKVVFRSKDLDLKILPNKLVEMLIIGTYNFNNFSCFEHNFIKMALEQLINLFELEYEMTQKQKADFKQKTHSAYDLLAKALGLDKLVSPLGPDEEEEINVLGEHDAPEDASTVC